MKRSPMTRKTGLTARKGLSSSTGLSRTTGLSRSSGLSANVPLQRSMGMVSGPGPSRKPSAAARAVADEWAVIREEAWEGWGRCCAVGGETLAWEQVHGHHRKLRSAGGLHVLENCLPVCTWHHQYIHGLGDQAYEAGWLVRAWLEPADVPVRVDLRDPSGTPP